MSRENHKRKQDRKLEHLRRRWRCKKLGCDFTFSPAVVLDALKKDEANRRAQRQRGFRLVPTAPMTIICARCNTPHFLTDDRFGVRLLTPAETLKLYVDIPNAAQAAETYKVQGKAAELVLVKVEG